MSLRSILWPPELSAGRWVLSADRYSTQFPEDLGNRVVNCRTEPSVHHMHEIEMPFQQNKLQSPDSMSTLSIVGSIGNDPAEWTSVKIAGPPCMLLYSVLLVVWSPFILSRSYTRVCLAAEMNAVLISLRHHMHIGPIARWVWQDEFFELDPAAVARAVAKRRRDYET